MDAGQHHLAVPGLGQPQRFLPDSLDITRADAAAHIGDDAKSAVAVTALLYLHHRAGVAVKVRDLHLFKRHAQHAVHRGDPGIASHRLIEQGNDLISALVADHQAQPAAEQPFRVLLRQAAGQNHLGPGVSFHRAAHGLQALPLTCSRHHAAVDHIHIGPLVEITGLIARLQKLLQHRLAVVLVYLAAQGIKRDCTQSIYSMSPDSVKIMVSAAIPAVSVRRMRGPSVMG